MAPSGRVLAAVPAASDASAGTHIFLAAEKEDRVCLPNTRFLIHQPSGGAQGQATDIEIHAREILKTREDINEILALHTKKPLEQVQVDTERDYWLGPEEAIEYGVLDSVLSGRSLEAVAT